ncbi:cholecystokinin receptor type A-like [Saccostrea cucullata]|uniref:cholecystokinin receptor type A-like n=1 Tax=Saccostrea cuccullata TaxID=36930 RepID=UPI002ED4FD2D
MNTTLKPSEILNSSSLHSVEDGGPIVAVVGMLTFFSVIGTTGNALVLYVYTRKRHKLAATVFIISLATTDLTTCIVAMPYTIIIEYLKYYVKYDIFCKMYMFFITSNVPFAAFIMVGIAFDRYFCIVHPFKHLMNAQRAKIITASMAGLAVSLGIITALNYSVYDIQICGGNSNTTCVKYTGVCKTSEILLPYSFTLHYQKLYTALFFLSLVMVIILYGLIYRSVLIRRAKRRRQRRSMCSLPLTKESWFSDYRSSVISSLRKHSDEKHEKNNIDSELLRQLTIRERGLVANIKTALMLFVVTAVFILVFLPAWLMAHQLIGYNRVIFYMYFAYNVANPIIYAFMNKAFRRQLKIVFKCM